MNRRSILTSAGTLLLASLAGCLAKTGAEGENEDNSEQPSDKSSEDGNEGLSANEKCAKECERDYLKTEVIPEDADSFSYSALVTDTHEPSVITLLVDFAVSIQKDDKPEAQGGGEYQVYYYISDNHDDAYRTEEADEDPRDGIKVDC